MTDPENKENFDDKVNHMINAWCSRNHGALLEEDDIHRGYKHAVLAGFTHDDLSAAYSLHETARDVALVEENLTWLRELVVEARRTEPQRRRRRAQEDLESICPTAEEIAKRRP